MTILRPTAGQRVRRMSTLIFALIALPLLLWAGIVFVAWEFW